MEKPIVALVQYQSSPQSLGQVLQACRGLEGLKPSDRVLLKPNLVGWDEKYPVAPYGVYTTSRIVEDMVILLKEAGARHITVAEGSTRTGAKDQGTFKLYQVFGYQRLQKRYGVRLVDLLEDGFQEVDFGEFTLKVANEALEADFLVNMPVLKTHNQAKLSLGLKNLKGCIHMRSRKFCHNATTPLDVFCSYFVEAIRPALTVLDGIYALERGPYYLGTAHRLNTLVASKDPLAVDLVGATLAGFDPQEVEHIALYAHRHGRSTRLEDLDLKGPDPRRLARPLSWDFVWREDDSGPKMWDKLGINGLCMPKYDKTLCTGCSGLYNPMLMLLTSCFKGRPFEGIQVLTGKKMKPRPGFKKTVLFGNCMIKANRKDPSIQEVVYVKGCPPSMEEMIGALEGMGLEPNLQYFADFRQSLIQKYKDNPDFDPAHFYLNPEQ